MCLWWEGHIHISSVYTTWPEFTFDVDHHHPYIQLYWYINTTWYSAFFSLLELFIKHIAVFQLPII